MSGALQLGLFSSGEPRLDEGFTSLRRTTLDHGAWYDYQRGWLAGADRLFVRLRDTMRWSNEQRMMYGRQVDTPRLLARAPDDDPLLSRMRTVLAARYGEDFVRVSAALYRDGNDSVAMHGDTTARDIDQAIVATLSLGAPRRFVLKPTAGGPSQSFDLGPGDLLVMGGTCQRTWRHGIPKVAHAGPRIAVMFRPVWTAIG